MESRACRLRAVLSLFGALFGVEVQKVKVASLYLLKPRSFGMASCLKTFSRCGNLVLVRNYRLIDFAGSTSKQG